MCCEPPSPVVAPPRWRRFGVGAALLSTVLSASCRVRSEGGLRPSPASGPSWPLEVLDAEAALRDLRPEDAERRLVGAGGIDVGSLERSWLLVDLGLARVDVPATRATVDALPDGSAADVLRAHARRDPDDRLARIRRALRSPAADWAHLEAALVLSERGGEREAVLSHADAASRSASPFVRREAALLSARACLDGEHVARVAAFCERAVAEDPRDPRPRAIASQAASLRGDRDAAALAALDALRLSPKSPRVARRLADLVRDGLAPDVVARLAEGLAGLLARPASAEAHALAGAVAEAQGRRAEAAVSYERALADHADPVPVDRRLRRLLFATGRRRAGAALLSRVAPPEAFDAEDNVVRDAWRALRAAAAQVADGTPTPAAAAGVVALAEALARVGAVTDAVACLEGAPGEPARALRGRLEAALRFEAALRDAVEEGYRAPARGADPAPVEALLARVAVLAREHLPPEDAAALATPTQGLRRVALLGAWLDHGASSSSPLVAWFRRHGQYLVLGQRSGQPAEAVLLSLASLRPKATVRTQGYVFSHDVAIGYDREIRGYVDFQGGVLSGAALPDGIWLDADAARREDHAVRATLRLADRTLLARLDRASREAPAPDGPEGVFALDDPQGLALRLARRYAARVGDDPWGSFDVLRAHESGHVLDLARHLPFWKGLPATAGLLASSGFSLGRVEARLEARAQLGALRDARHPDRALLDVVRVLPLVERTPEAHERGYRDLAAALVRVLQREASRFPAVDPTRVLLPQLDRLDPEQVRWLADVVAARGFSSADGR